MTDSPVPRPRNVRRDLGGWISGPAAIVKPVAADRILGGDVLLLDDGTSAQVTDLRRGDFWMNTGDRGAGVAIGWRSVTGSASGVLFRAPSALLLRVMR